MKRFFQRGLLVLSSLILFVSCSVEDGGEVISKSHKICFVLLGGASLAASGNGATDFEWAEIKYGSSKGWIYVGYFPDFPKFNPDVKFKEHAGDVHYIGEVEADGVVNYLYRFGLGDQPSIHVLIKIPASDDDFRDAFRQGVSKRIRACD